MVLDTIKGGKKKKSRRCYNRYQRKRGNSPNNNPKLSVDNVNKWGLGDKEEHQGI